MCLAAQQLHRPRYFGVYDLGWSRTIAALDQAVARKIQKADAKTSKMAQDHRKDMDKTSKRMAQDLARPRSQKNFHMQRKRRAASRS